MFSLRAIFLGLLLFAGSVIALFEDQVFKFDWRQQYLGVAQDLTFEGATNIVLRTSSNVVASVDADSGHIKWRHIFSDGELLASSVHEKLLTTILRVASNEGSYVISTWNSETGILINEFRVSSGPLHAKLAFAHKGKVAYIVGTTTDGAVKAYGYDLKKGLLIDSYTYSTGSVNPQCIALDGIFVCLSESLRMVYFTGLPFVKGASLNAVQLSTLLETGDVPIGINGVSLNKVVINIKSAAGTNDNLVLTFGDGKLAKSNVLRGPVAGSMYFVAGCKNSDELLLIEQRCSDLKGGCLAYDNKLEISSLAIHHETKFEPKYYRGKVANAWASCEPQTQNEPNYQLVLLFEDGSISSVTPLGNLMWSREDGLADVVTGQLVSKGLHIDDENEELSSLDLAGLIYDGSNERDIFQQFIRRIKLHASHLHSLFTHFWVVKDLSVILQMKDTSVDDFGIRKIIVAATSHRKIYGIDSVTGRIAWQIFYRGSLLDTSPEELYLFVQRTALHYGHEGRCTLVYSNEVSGLPEMLQFNPINGKVISTKSLGSKLIKAILLHHPSDDHIRPLLLITDDKTVHVEPESASKSLASLSGKLFLSVIDSTREQVVGNQILADKDGKISLSPVWTFSSPGTKILKLVNKPTEEVVHSQGRVMADRSVLFKYINPNLGFILTEGKDAGSKTFINVYLTDLVTGRIIFSAGHKRVLGPYHVVHSENWAVYSFFNEKARRAELVSLELFEGTTQSNSSIFSSLTNTVTPLVERQAFILGPTYVTAMKDTLTEKAITTKHIIMATMSGAIYDVSRYLLDPRRPNMNTPVDMREHGLPPYIPELQFPAEVVLNYNQSVANPIGIITAPTDLESTSVVFVHGLDLYCTRVTPSKGFDLLKDDFDYSIIALVLLALVVASVATRKFAQLKNLRQAWR